MIGKPLLALLAAPLLVSAAPADEPVFATIQQVRQVLCDKTRGTAWRVGSGAFVTARHVITGTGCTIDGEPVEITWQSAEKDMAVLRTKVWGVGLEVDCGGFIDGQAYAGIGYARGGPLQRVIFVMFSQNLHDTLPRWNDFSTLWGNRWIPGMSGGAVFNQDGKVVALVNGYNSGVPLSYSQALKGSPLCSDPQ